MVKMKIFYINMQANKLLDLVATDKLNAKETLARLTKVYYKIRICGMI